ncbi:MAG TPA: alanine dehydrogenase [Terriglobia bacterium]|nr:alanine dehydrogenase [Terriglobia bacterium]
MIIGVPKEIVVRRAVEEKRVSLSPAAVSDLTANGIEVIVEKGAGDGAHFSDDEYREAGASLVYSKEEAYRRTDLVVKVQAPLEEEWPFLKENQVLMGFLLLGIMPRPLLQRVLDQNITAIGMELIVKEDGSHPLQRAMSKIAGKMAPQIAGRLLQSNNRVGRGILLGGIEGVPPADVVILGAGTLGSNAARSFAGLGATVHVMDKDVRQLEKVAQETGDRVVTLPYNQRNLAKLVQFADVLICAVQIPGERTPQLVSRDMVKSMKAGSVLIDFAVDQGGTSETTRLTPTEDMVYIEEGVTHFAVPNVPSWVARTASHVLSNVLLPYLLTVGNKGIVGALKLSPEIRAGVCTYDGHVTSTHLPQGLGKGYQPVESILQ